MTLRILIAEDDPRTRSALVEILQREGYEASSAASGLEAIRMFDSSPYELACLDVMMPGKSGYDVCRHIRASNPKIPILFITAKAEEIDKVVGLELGADDYIAKPFGANEVIARIRAVTRRCISSEITVVKVDNEKEYQMGDLLIVPRQLRAHRNGFPPIELTPREIRILHLLHRRVGEVVHRNELFRDAWGSATVPNSRTLDQTISTLRKRIEIDSANPKIVETVYGVGYRYPMPT